MKTKTLETGVIIDAFLKPIEIMAGHQNNLYFNLYISYHFGKKYDASLNRDYRKEQRIQNRKN